MKYHRGFSGDFVTEDGHNIRMTLSPNPSHLEFVNAVVLGRARAKQRLRGDTERKECVPILIHGDGAFPGQGVVAETLWYFTASSSIPAPCRSRVRRGSTRS